MGAYNWSRLVIERRYTVFEGITTESVVRYEYTPEQLENESIIRISGREFADYVLSVQTLGENDIAFFEAIRSDNPLVGCEPYESRGVLFLGVGDVHKTPVQKVAYNKTYRFEVSVVE